MAKITKGELAPGSWLPSERELAHEFGVDRSTIRRALRMLADQGLALLQPGAGVRVRPSEPLRRDAADITRQVGSWRGFHVSAMEAGREPFTRTTVREIKADANLARWLGVPTTTLVLERARVQGIIEEPPLQTATTYVLLDIVKQIPILREVNTGPGGIYSRLEEIGYRVLFEESISCRHPRTDEQAVLAVAPDQPVLTLWRRCYDQTNRIIEVTHRVVVGDRHELVYRYGPGA